MTHLARSIVLGLPNVRTETQAIPEPESLRDGSSTTRLSGERESVTRRFAYTEIVSPARSRAFHERAFNIETR